MEHEHEHDAQHIQHVHVVLLSSCCCACECCEGEEMVALPRMNVQQRPKAKMNASSKTCGFLMHDQLPDCDAWCHSRRPGLSVGG